MASSYDAAAIVPVDFLIKKSTLGLSGDDLTVFDAGGHLGFRVNRSRCGSSKTLCDAAGNPSINVVYQDGVWRGYRRNSRELSDLFFTVHKSLHSPIHTELDVFMSGKSSMDSKPIFGLRGNPFRRSCTIIKGDSIVAQTSLLYKLNKMVYSKRKFQLTIYPGNDPILVMAMLIPFYWT